MTKPIRFHLIVNGLHLRTIQDLKDNFDIHEVLNLYSEGILENWLKSLGQEGQGSLKELATIEEKSSEEEKINKILTTFFSNDDLPASAHSALQAVTYYTEHSKHLQKLEQQEFNCTKVISTYHEEYTSLLEQLDTSCYDINTLMGIVHNLEQSYFGLLRIDFQRLFNKYINSMSNIIIAFYTQEKTRELFSDKLKKKFSQKINIASISSNKQNETALIKEEIFFLLMGGDPSELDQATDALVLSDKESTEKFFPFLPETFKADPNFFTKYLRSAKFKCEFRKTGDFSDTIVEKGTKVLVLHFPANCYVMSHRDKSGKKYSKSDYYKSLPILDGLDYQSKTDEKPLVYLEIK